MKYGDLIATAQHYEAIISKDILSTVSMLEIRLESILPEIERANYVSAWEKKALADTVRYLQRQMRRPDKAKLPESLLSCLNAMFEQHQEPLVYDVIQLYKQAQLAGDKFRIVAALKGAIDAAFRPVREEARAARKVPRSGFYD